MSRPATVPLRAVTFDFWNTLIEADPAGGQDRRLTAWLGLLAGEGIDLDEPTIVGAMRHAGARFDEHWKANQIYGAEQAVADMIEHLGLDVSPAFRAGLLESIVDPGPGHRPKPTPNIGPTLDVLRAAGIRIGIICDVGLAPSPTLRRHLAQNGLLDRFDHWSFSDEVGSYKPGAAIFEHALAGLGDIPPEAAAHVGDLRRTDVAGALAHGLFAVRYSGVYDDPGDPDDGTDRVEGDAVVADHAELPAALGLA